RERGIGGGAGVENPFLAPGFAVIRADADGEALAFGAGGIGEKNAAADAKHAGLADGFDQGGIEFHFGPGEAAVTAAGNGAPIPAMVGAHVLKERTVGEFDEG